MKNRFRFPKIVWRIVLMNSVWFQSHAAAEPQVWTPTHIPNYSVQTRPALEPVDLYPGPHLFIDDYLIAESAHLDKKTHSPDRFLEEPILGYQQHTTQPYLTVLKDEQTQTFRMWYNHGIGKDAYIAYAESKDGIQWQTPSLGIFGDDNRLLFIPGGFDAEVLDEGPNFPNPAQRYKLAWWGPDEKGPEEENRGLRVATSPDGIHWTPYPDNPVIPYYKKGDPRFHLMASDIITVFYDPLRNRYGAFFKSTAIPEDNYIPGPRAGHYFRRLVAMSASEDFFHWRRPWRIMLPEPRDEGLLEFYSCCQPLVRGTLMITFVRMLHDEKPVEPGGDFDGIGYTTLATSRDGVSWQRHDDIFFDRNPKPDTWDRAMTWVGSVLPMGEELYVYYGGYKLGHKRERDRWRQLGLAKMPRDRFVSRGAEGDQPGRLLTAPFRCPPDGTFRLTLNAQAQKGSIRVRICDEYGRPLLGYDYSDMEPVTGDSLALPVRWNTPRGEKTDAVSLTIPVFRLDVELTHARLFALEAIPCIRNNP